ncbi:hypothetical protein LguiB_028748 [Lonicera macranthoides]
MACLIGKLRNNDHGSGNAAWSGCDEVFEVHLVALCWVHGEEHWHWNMAEQLDRNWIGYSMKIVRRGGSEIWEKDLLKYEDFSRKLRQCKEGV